MISLGDGDHKDICLTTSQDKCLSRQKIPAKSRHSRREFLLRPPKRLALFLYSAAQFHHGSVSRLIKTKVLTPLKTYVLLRDMSIKALRKAIDRAGGQTALATLIGKTQGHISKWLEREYVPAECVIPIERATGIPRHELRPDLYPATPSSKVA